MASRIGKIALFIDGTNTHAAAKALGFDLDFKRLLLEFQSRGVLVRAFYYAVLDGAEFASVRPLVDWLDYNGYAVVTKGTSSSMQAATANSRQSGRRTCDRCHGAWRSR